MGGRFLRALFGAVAFVLFICFWHVEIVKSGATASTATSPAATSTTTGSFRHLEATGRDGPATFHPGLDPKYIISKRRVPNGPDPIHNRKAGKSRQPPGRA